MIPDQSPILRGLNPAQREAVVNYDSPSLIIAGAGSGKTRVLTSRIAYMIEQGVAPHHILALTFTKKAAEEMRSRIAAMLPDRRSRYIHMGTFHSIFASILRENAEALGYPSSYTIYEPSDVKSLLKTIIKEKNLSDEKYKPAFIASRISYAKNCLVTPGAYLASSTYAAEDRQLQIPEFGAIYSTYCQRCKHQGAMDFDDLLLQTNYLLKDHPEVLARYQERFKYILVDEYQDTNYAQYLIVRRLSQHHSQVCVVGDDSQSIYSFRGAKIENILSFQRDYPTAKVFKLEQNYRSTRTIVGAANSLIEHNQRRMKKECFSVGAEGEKIRLMKAYTDREEADMVVRDLLGTMRDYGEEWGEVAILYRTNNQSAALEKALRSRGIPYRIYKGSSFYEHKEIKDLLCYIRLVVNPRDDEAFKRIINTPARGIGDTTVQRIADLAKERGVSMWEAVDSLLTESVTDTVQRAIARKVADFVALIRSLSLARATMGLYEVGLEIANKSGILPLYRNDSSPESEGAVANIEELLNSMQEFSEECEAEIRNGEREAEERATLDEWLQTAMLLTDMDKENDKESPRVTLMTVHSAKGLEYKYVYIVGMEQNLFPSQRATESPDGVEEERRLFYVAITRAEVKAVISFAESRFKWGRMEFSRPSCFLREIDPRYLEAEFDLEELQPRNRFLSQEEDEQRPSALEELRRRFDYRFQQQREGSEAPANRYGGGYRQERRPADGYSGSAKRYARTTTPSHTSSKPTTPNISIAQPSTEGMRRLGVRPNEVPATPASPCCYQVGERVEHPTFGEGVIQRIDALAQDYKLVIAFVHAGEKTLLAKFAKLTKR